MLNIVVVNNLKDWMLDIANVEIITAKEYLTNAKYLEIRNIRVFNFCRSYKYQTIGYYVSLLASARSHKIIPNIITIQDSKHQKIVKAISNEFDTLIQKSFAKIKSKKFTLSIYFSKNFAKQHEKLAKQIYSLFQAPFIRVNFIYNKKWLLKNISFIPITEIPDAHKPYVFEFAKDYFLKKRFFSIKKSNTVYDMAILIDPNDRVPPSNKKAIQNFTIAAEEIGLSVECITKEDFNRIAEFDALFIRDTTDVDDYTYLFARHAFAEGLVVIDDPESIVKCTNKVYLTEVLSKAKINIPKTLIIHKDNKHLVVQELGLPCVLKQLLERLI